MLIQKRWVQALGALVVALLAVMVLDRLTNRLVPEEVPGHVWDYMYYIDMAEHGVWGNPHLVSPYAYRFVTPLLARAINQALGTPTYIGFKLLAYLGLVGMLWGVYFLARHFRLKYTLSLLVMLIPALALFQVKFLLFDFYRPDQLAYPLMVFCLLAMLKRRYWLAAGLAVIGLFVREFLIIPVPILLYLFGREWWQNKRRLVPLVWAGLLILVTLAALAAPRLLIPVVKTQQYLDPLRYRTFLRVILRMTFDLKRDVNVIYNLVAYALPLILLATPERLKRAWQALGEYRAWMVIYVLVCLFETMYGGADLERFVTFFFIPQSLLLIFIFQQGVVSLHEVIYMVIAMVIFNRLLYPFPIWDFTAYLNFYGGYGDFLSTASLLRWLELVGLILGGLLLRWTWERLFPAQAVRL